MAIERTYVRGTSGDDDRLRSDNKIGSILAAGDGNDILGGGIGADILIGGSGDDQLYGGKGADQFRFFGNDIDGPSDLDRIYDLNFADGDTLVFGNYGALFADAEGINAFDGGDSAIISSWDGLAAAVANSGGRITVGQEGAGTNGVLLVNLEINGQIQTLRITGGLAAYEAASGTDI